MGCDNARTKQESESKKKKKNKVQLKIVQKSPAKETAVGTSRSPVKTKKTNPKPKDAKRKAVFDEDDNVIEMEVDGTDFQSEDRSSNGELTDESENDSEAESLRHGNSDKEETNDVDSALSDNSVDKTRGSDTDFVYESNDDRSPRRRRSKGHRKSHVHKDHARR